VIFLRLRYDLSLVYEDNKGPLALIQKGKATPTKLNLSTFIIFFVVDVKVEIYVDYLLRNNLLNWHG
jgi:hypothetical protein